MFSPEGGARGQKSRPEDGIRDGGWRSQNLIIYTIVKTLGGMGADSPQKVKR